MAQAQVVVVHTKGHILLKKQVVSTDDLTRARGILPKISHLKVFEALRDEVLDPQRQLQLVNLLLVGELGEYGGAATILKRIRGLTKTIENEQQSQAQHKSGRAHTCSDRKSLLRTPKAISVLAAVLHTIGYNGSVT